MSMNKNPELNDYEIARTAISGCSSAEEVATWFYNYDDELRNNQPETWRFHFKELYILLFKQLLIKEELRSKPNFILGPESYQQSLTQSTYNFKIALEKIEGIMEPYPELADMRKEADELRSLSIQSSVEDTNVSQTNTAKDRIGKWEGSVAVFSYQINQWIDKGYLTAGLHDGEVNYTAIANAFWDLIEFEGSKEYFQRSMRSGSNSLADTKKAKFVIPKITDLG